MKVSDDNTTAGTAGTQTAAQGPQAAPEAPRLGGSAPGSKLFLALDTLGAGNLSLGAAGREYLETLKSNLQDPTRQHEVKIEIRKLLSPAETYVFFSPTHAVALVFSEVQPQDTDKDGNVIPMMTKVSPQVANRIRSDFEGGFKLIQTLLVRPEDYCKVGQMVARIRSLLMAASMASGEQVMADWFRDPNTRVSVDVNIGRLNSYVEQRYPHATLPRMDFGYTVNIASVDQQGRSQGSRIIGGAGAFVDFVQETPTWNAAQGAMVPRFTPVVHLSHAESDLIMPAMLAMLLPIAFQEFLAGGLWKASFQDLSKDRSNLGNLIIDYNTSKPMQLDQVRQVEELIQACFNPPVLVVDVIDGRAHMPGLELFTDPGKPEYSKAILNLFANFFGGTGITFSTDTPVLNTAMTIEGTVLMGQPNPLDSRFIDYLSMVKIGRDPAELRELLSLPQSFAHAQIRASKVKALSPQFEPSWINYICVMNASFVADVQQALLRFIQVQSDRRGGAAFTGLNLTDASQLTQQAMGRGFQGTGMGGGVFGGGIGGYYGF